MENMDYAAKHAAAGQSEEAAQIYQVVLLADPMNEKARAGLAAIGTYERCILEPTVLGINYVCRPVRRSPILWIVLYPVNRVFSVLDIVSFHVGLEGGAYVDAHVTHVMQASAGAGGGMQLGWWLRRDLAVGSAHVAGVALGPFSAESEGFSRFGTGGIRSSAFSIAGLSRPSDLEYQRYRDYWGIGVRAIAGIAGAEVEFHPLKLVDAITGIFFIDFLREDFGHTKGLDLETHEFEAMEDLISTLSSEEMRTRMNERMIAPPPPPLSAQPAAVETPAPARLGTPVAGGTYVIAAGDTLASIAQRAYGSATMANIDRIYQANKAEIGADPDGLKVGMEIVIPPVR